MRAADGDERHGPYLPKRGYEDVAQCDINPSLSPLLKHYPQFQEDRDGVETLPLKSLESGKVYDGSPPQGKINT